MFSTSLIEYECIFVGYSWIIILINRWCTSMHAVWARTFLKILCIFGCIKQ